MAHFGRLLNVCRTNSNKCLKLSGAPNKNTNLLLISRCISTSNAKFEQKEISEHVSADAGALTTGEKGIFKQLI